MTSDNESPLDPETLQMIEEVNAVVKAERDLFAETGQQPTSEQIAARSGVDLQKVIRMRNVAPEPISFDED